jgi:hypothetical protein
VTSQTPRGQRILSAGGSSGLQGARVIHGAVMIGRRILDEFIAVDDALMMPAECGRAPDADGAKAAAAAS